MINQYLKSNTSPVSPSYVCDLRPLHETLSIKKVNELVDSLKSNQWIGAPLVECGGQLLNGTHRQEAIAIIGRDCYNFEIPIIELTDAFELDADEVDQLVYAGDWVELTKLCYAADPDTAAYLGLDCH